MDYDLLCSHNPHIDPPTGGAYIPPARLAALQAEALANATALSPEERAAHTQRLTWDALRRSINGLVNKLSTANIKYIIPELFGENLLRARGLLCRVVMKAQAVAQPYTPVYAAMMAIINTKFPQIGELLVVRLVAQFRRAWRRGDKTVCVAVIKFLAHLVNQKVVHDLLALQILLLLLSKPTDDSVELAVGMIKEVGALLQLESKQALDAVFERMRSILHEGADIDKRTMYMVEVLFQERKEEFATHPTIPADLDLVEEADQITHTLQLTAPLDTQDMLNVFHVDPDYEANERAYRQMKAEILGLDDDEGSDEGSVSGSDEEDGEDEDDEEDGQAKAVAEAAIEKAHQAMIIQDQTNTNLVNLRRAIYLVIMSSLSFEECAHKILKLDIAPGQEIEVVNMIV
jgi:pre-mRNA-splicing factor CWC22